MEKAKNISKKMATDARLKNMLLKVSEDHSGFTQDELKDARRICDLLNSEGSD